MPPPRRSRLMRRLRSRSRMAKLDESIRAFVKAGRVLALYIAAFAFALATLFVAPSCARAGETVVDVSIGPLVGTHAEAGTRDTVAPVPIPIVAVSQRESMFEIFAEGLPISPPIDSSSTTQSVATNLSFENVLLCAYVQHDRLSFGAGETIYNQVSRYQPPVREFRRARRACAVTRFSRGRAGSRPYRPWARGSRTSAWSGPRMRLEASTSGRPPAPTRRAA
jgi:hypothetical protein